MPKTYLEEFRDSAEEQYLSGNYPLMALSLNAKNKGKVRFTPIHGQYDDGTVDAITYHIQRMRRVKEGTQQNSHRANRGDDYIATLNQATDITWDTVDTKRSQQFQLLISVKRGEGTNALEDATPYRRTIANKAKVKLISKEERGVENILTSAIANSQIVDLTSAITGKSTQKDKRDVIQNAFVEKADHINEFVDEYKYNSKPVALYYPRIGKIFSKSEGQDYQSGTDTFSDAYKKGFRFQDLNFLPEDVFKSRRLNASNHSNAPAGNDSDLVILGFIITDDGYADSGLETGHIEVNEKLVRADVVGHIYDDLNVIVDKARISVITASATALKTIDGFANLPSTAYKKVSQA